MPLADLGQFGHLISGFLIPVRFCEDWFSGPNGYELTRFKGYDFTRVYRAFA